MKLCMTLIYICYILYIKYIQYIIIYIIYMYILYFNNACSTNCKYRTAAKLYTLCCTYIIVNTLHKCDSNNNNNNNNNNSLECRSQWPRGLRRGSAGAHLLGLQVRNLPEAWMSVCCKYCVLPGRGLCDRPITRPEESYRLWFV